MVPKDHVEPPKTSPKDGHYQLSKTEQQLVTELRSRLKDELVSRYDTDFNLYRWIKASERSKHKADLDLAECLLRKHLKYRELLNLNSDSIPSWDDNPLHTKNLMPYGRLHYMPSNNRYLLWLEHSEKSNGALKTVPSSELIQWNFCLYEAGLRVVNEREKATGAMSGICLVVDVRNYALTPDVMYMVRSGYGDYVARLFHYEHYPELVYPTYLINASKILTIPYQICQRFMPHDFTDRYRVNGYNYKDALLREMTEDELPKQLNGRYPHSDALTPIPPNRANWPVLDKSTPPRDQIRHIQIPARKRKLFAADCDAGTILKWWFHTDSDVVFGVYFTPPGNELNGVESGDILDRIEMVHPTFLILHKVPEKGSHECQKTGTYYFLFCNKRSWFYGRKIQLKIECNGRINEVKEIGVQ